MILCGSELRFSSGAGRDEIVRLAVDAGFEGLALGAWCTRADASELVAAAAASGLPVPVAAAPLMDGPLPPGKRLPFLASVDDPEERRAAAKLIATTIAAAVPLGVQTFTVNFGDVRLSVPAEKLAWWFRRREMDDDDAGAEALAASLAERRARSAAIIDACRGALDLIVPTVERAGAILAIELPGSPWGAPSPREASILLDEYLQAPIGIVWDVARMAVLARLGAAPGPERTARLRASTRLWRANEAVGIEIGYLPGQGERPDGDGDAAPPKDVPIVVTGRRDSSLDEVRQARALSLAQQRST